jgi:arabinosaccharide transport system substrate-binding protein
VRRSSPLAATLQALPPAVWILILIAAVSSVMVALRARSDEEGMLFWVFARAHFIAYGPLVEEWNAQNPDRPVQMRLLDYQALERRMLSGFLSGTPVADLIEVERGIAGRAFTGPLEDVGFVDLTDRLRAEGLLDEINEPSFSPWTSRGRIFGLPHDVHPVLLAYRADLVEEAGIDVSQIETWEDFERVLRPLMVDFDGDGRPDRYLLNFWPTNNGAIELLLLQAGGALFDAKERPVLDSEINARVLSRLVRWSSGPDRFVVEAPDFSAAGHKLRLDGVVVAQMMPDWLAGVWKQDLPGLAGKVKLMPLPAWERGGRRTSVSGGTMLGIPKTAPDFEAHWAFAKHLYLSEDLAERFYRASNIVPPVKRAWSLAIFDEPDPYFSGQPAGRLFLDQAAHVPHRTSSPFNPFAMARLGDALLRLIAYAERTGTYEPAALEPEARRLLAFAQDQVRQQIERNVFLRDAAVAAAPPP